MHCIFKIQLQKRFCDIFTWWHGNAFRVIGPLWGEPPVFGGFLWRWPVMQSFDIFFNKRLIEKFSFRRFDKLWRSCNVILRIDQIIITGNCTDSCGVTSQRCLFATQMCYFLDLYPFSINFNNTIMRRMASMHSEAGAEMGSHWTDSDSRDDWTNCGSGPLWHIYRASVASWRHDMEVLSASWWRHQMENFSVNSPHKGQWRGAFLVFSLISSWIIG